MIAANHNECLTWQFDRGITLDLPRRIAIWEEAYAWLALLPTLFITISGRIQTDSSPVAFRFTAMEEDSLARRLTRLGCSLIILFLISTRFRSIYATCKQSKLLLVLPVLAFVSSFWSHNPSHAVVDAANLTLTAIFAVYLYLRYPGERLLSFLIFAALIALLSSMIAVVAFPGVGIDTFQQDSWRGIFGQRNNCAAVCTLFLALGLHYRPHALVERIMRGLVLLLSLTFILMSGSRTGWILTALTLLLTYGFRLTIRMRSLDRLVFLMGLSVLAIFLAFFIVTNLNQALALMGKDPTMTQRTLIWAEVLPSIAKHPVLGYGYSSFWSGLNGESMQIVLTTGWMEGQAQDGYLDILLQLGLTGLVPLLWVFMRAFKQGARAIERRTEDPVVLFAIVLLPLMLVENISESSFLLPLGIPWFYSSIALLALAVSNRSAEAA